MRPWLGPARARTLSFAPSYAPPRRGPRRPSEALFRAALEEALLTLHGAVGGAVALEVLRFEASSGEGLVSVDARDAHKLGPAAALVTQLRGEQCTLQARARTQRRSGAAGHGTR